jgi:hypothetical protein
MTREEAIALLEEMKRQVDGGQALPPLDKEAFARTYVRVIAMSRRRSAQRQLARRQAVWKTPVAAELL